MKFSLTSFHAFEVSICGKPRWFSFAIKNQVTVCLTFKFLMPPSGGNFVLGGSFSSISWWLPDDPYGGRQQYWQQNAPPPPDRVVAAMQNPPPPPPVASRPSPPPERVAMPPPPPPPLFMSSSGGSGSNYSGTENPYPPPSPGIALGFSKSTFSYEELARATDGFTDANLLGQGGFGYVHRGVLPNGKEVAVKQLKAGSGQGEREFQAEVEIISRVHHKHLVSLVGYCITGAHRLLVYEFVPNNTLEFHLHGMFFHQVICFYVKFFWKIFQFLYPGCLCTVMFLLFFLLWMLQGVLFLMVFWLRCWFVSTQ